ncbi:unnamed protein product [Musa hybrid cultivar]
MQMSAFFIDPIGLVIVDRCKAFVQIGINNKTTQQELFVSYRMLLLRNTIVLWRCTISALSYISINSFSYAVDIGH